MVVEEVEGLGERLKRLRKDRHLSVRELARLANVSVSYIYAIESGVRGSNITKLELIAEALQIPLSALWTGDGG